MRNAARSAGIEALWAKSPRQEGQSEAEYHPLVCHLRDVAAVAEALWDLWLKPPVRRRVARTLGLEEPHARKWTAWLAGLHDLGKASPAFQYQWAPGWRRLEDLGLGQRVEVKVHHGVIGASVIPLALVARGVPLRAANALAGAVAGHHGVFANDAAVCAVGPSARGEGAWDDLRARLAVTAQSR